MMKKTSMKMRAPVISRKMENSCETGGGVNVKEIENFDSMQVETEPAENFDEMSPCGCPQQQYLLRT